jgi:hypothetical protein
MKDSTGRLTCVFRGSTTLAVRDSQRRWPLIRGWCARPPRLVRCVSVEATRNHAASAHHVGLQRLKRQSIDCSQPVLLLQTPLLTKQSQ